MPVGRKKRKPETVLIGDDLYILWQDGEESRYEFFTLRDQCPCAHCVDELTGQKTLQTESIPANIRMLRCEYVGNYALRPYWSDHHHSGIYTFRMLREISHPQPAHKKEI